MLPKLSEEKHQHYLDISLEAVRSLRQKGLEKTLPDLLPYITDSLHIARNIGYSNLAESYASLFRQEGLIFEF